MQMQIPGKCSEEPDSLIQAQFRGFCPDFFPWDLPIHKAGQALISKVDGFQITG